MGQPGTYEVHVDALMTGWSQAYIQAQADFIATRVFPVVNVQKQTDKYAVFTKADWFRDEAKKRAGGTESAGSGYNVDFSNTFSCDVVALHKDIDDQTRANSDAPLSPDRDATLFVTQRLLLQQEIQWAAKFFATGLWGTSNTPGNLWSDYVASTPLEDMETGIKTVLSNTGFMPNTLVLGYDVWSKLKNHPDIVDRINGGAGPGNPAVVTQQQLAQLIGVERVFVAKAVKNTAVEGETAVYSFVHGKHAVLCYVTPTPGMLSPTAGLTFAWSGVSQGIGGNIGISRIRIDERKCDRIEGEIAYDQKVIGSDLGYAFISVVS